MLDHKREAVKFDPSGNYVRRWLPVLSRLPNKWIHRWLSVHLHAASPGMPFMKLLQHSAGLFFLCRDVNCHDIVSGHRQVCLGCQH